MSVREAHNAGAGYRFGANILRALAGILFLGVAAISLASLFSDLYTSIARQKRLQSTVGAFSLRASELATRLAPWKTDAWFEYSLNVLRTNSADLALDSAGMTVLLSSADAKNWALFARAHGLNRRFNDSFRISTAQSIHLAPTAPNWRRQVALDGVYWWRDGDTELRKLWLGSMKMSLQLAPAEFLRSVVWSHREVEFCDDVGPQLHLEQWCSWIVKARQACQMQGLQPHFLRYCEDYRMLSKGGA